MRCRTGVTTITTCQVCNVRGIQIGYVWPMVRMRCPVCGVEWRTLSAICEHCKTPSGSPWEGECQYCKSKTQEARSQWESSGASDATAS